MPEAQTRVWEADRPIRLRPQLAAFQRGPGDPTCRWGAGESFVRSAQTPLGPGTLHLVCRRAGHLVEALAWGTGAEWLRESAPG
ncbi:MAG: DNA-3-methyladenine glycosylase 2 family protein, partial [Micrococcales bacterium]|nr:DNA-3-methyladenine glycosylase 2 family protein [Micrococcales bacterium]